MGKFLKKIESLFRWVQRINTTTKSRLANRSSVDLRPDKDEAEQK